jgi:hypothetical protein
MKDDRKREDNPAPTPDTQPKLAATSTFRRIP